MPEFAFLKSALVIRLAFFCFKNEYIFCAPGGTDTAQGRQSDTYFPSKLLFI